MIFCFVKQPPFVGGNREKIQQKIIKDKMKLPGFLSSEAHSVLKGVVYISRVLNVQDYWCCIRFQYHVEMSFLHQIPENFISIFFCVHFQ